MKNRKLSLTAVLFVLLASVAFAQEDGTLPMQLGPYRFSGSLTAGYRSTDITGISGRTSDLWAERLFNEQYNLRSGFKAFDLNLYGEKPIGGEGLFDQLFLNATTTGPITNGMLRVRSLGTYDFKIDYQRSEYFFDRYDSIFSDLRQFDMVRNQLHATLTVTPIEMLDVQLAYGGNGRSGDQTIPRTPFFEMPTEPGVWGGYSRANFYWIDVPRDDWTNNYSAKVTARLPLTTVSAGAGYRKFTETLVSSPASLTSLNYLNADSTPNDLGIVGTSKVSEPLSTYDWTDTRNTSGPYYFGEVVFKPLDWMSATASARMDKTDGDGTVVGSQSGIIRADNAGRRLVEYRASFDGTTTQSLDQLTASLNLAVRPVSGVQIVGGYEYRSTDKKTSGEYRTTIDTSIGSNGDLGYVTATKDSIQMADVNTSYDIPEHTISGQVFYTPIPELSLRGGVRYSMRTPESRMYVDGELDSVFSTNLSKKTAFTTLTFNVYYRPIKEVRVRARVENKTGNSYLEGTSDETDFTPRRVPKDNLGISGSVDADIMEGLMLSVGAETNDGKNSLIMPGVSGTPELEHKGRNLSGALTYMIDEKTSVSLTGNYEQHDFSIPSTFTRGTLIGIPPFGTSKTDSMTVLVAENTIDRYIGVNASSTVIDGLTLSAGLDYVRSTGGSSMTTSVVTANSAGDVERMNGPYSHWEARGHVQYDFVRQLGLAVDGVWTSREEDQTDYYVALNNFNASMFTVSLVVKL